MKYDNKGYLHNLKSEAEQTSCDASGLCIIIDNMQQISSLRSADPIEFHNLLKLQKVANKGDLGKVLQVRVEIVQYARNPVET